MMEELSKNLMIAVQVVYVYASQQHAKLRTNDRGVDKRLRQEVTTRKAASCSTENSCRTREAQAYIPPAVVQMTRRIYTCACARHGVREIGAIYGNSVRA